jgi:hypothetical protein
MGPLCSGRRLRTLGHPPMLRRFLLPRDEATNRCRAVSIFQVHLGQNARGGPQHRYRGLASSSHADVVPDEVEDLQVLCCIGLHQPDEQHP